MSTAVYFALFLLAGILFGIIITYLLMRIRVSRTNNLEKQLDDKNQAFSALGQRAEILDRSVSDLKEQNKHLETLKANQAITIAKLETEKGALTSQMEQHTEDIRTMRDQFTKDFQLLANKIFDEKSEKFTLQNRSSLDQILTPLKEKIADFQKKVEETHSSNLKESTGLRQELKNLKEMSQKMTSETENLTKALKNDSKVQGNWGEMILENILQNSGLSPDREYFTQQSFTTEDGRRLQPDVQIKLPDNKWVVVDSKVSLKGYEQYISDSNENAKDSHLKSHLNSIRTHIKGLSNKQYQNLGGGKKLDFILMFVPIEPAYLLALNYDQSLFNEAYEKNIVMVSPSTLIASLKIIASTWKHEYQNKNAQEIAKRGKHLLEKFIGFAEDFEKIGDSIGKTQNTYLDAMKKLRDGRGSLVSQAKQLEDLGVKSAKQLSDTFSNEEMN